jgi:oxygen-dependent protoporphyrinogen oxidase
MKEKKQIAVIGAGVSGLTIAYWLGQRGFNVTVFEKEKQVGGTVITERKNGYLIDLGPNSALETSETLKNLIRELGIEDQKVYGNEASNNRYILRNGKLQALPMSPVKFLKTPLFSWKAKLRLLREPFISPTKGEDISLADFVRYRLGTEFLDYAINPFVAGVYAGDPENLSTAAAFPKLYALEQKYGSFIKGALRGARERKKRKEVSKDRARLFSFLDGMETFPKKLAEVLKGEILLGTEVEDIQYNKKFELTFQKTGKLQTRTFDQVVLSVPTKRMSLLLKTFFPEKAKKLLDIYYPPVAVVFMGFKAQDIKRELDGFGFLVPKVENRKILGSIWSSSIFPARAPEGHVAFTTFVGGTRQPDLAHAEEEDLENMVYSDLQDLVGITGKPDFIRIKRWPRAIPQYTLGYQTYQKSFDEMEESLPGLFFAGNFRRGISVGDSVLCAHETFNKMINS